MQFLDLETISTVNAVSFFFFYNELIEKNRLRLTACVDVCEQLSVCRNGVPFLLKLAECSELPASQSFVLALKALLLFRDSHPRHTAS